MIDCPHKPAFLFYPVSPPPPQKRKRCIFASILQLPGEHFAAAAPDRLITFRVFQQPYHTVILTHPHKAKHKALGESKRRDHIYNEIITTNITPFEPSKANLGHHIIRTDRSPVCVCVWGPPWDQRSASWQKISDHPRCSNRHDRGTAIYYLRTERCDKHR